ncbi:transposase [Oricola indica]|uniref:transposase n=1 Tax=Oricola indica TaxID=2872591 RepID=UPI003CCC2D0A
MENLIWTLATWRQHCGDHPRYGSNLSDAEWEIIAPFLPAPATTGLPRQWPMPEIMNTIFYVPRGGIAWRLLPKDFPPMTTVYSWFLRFRRELSIGVQN